MQYSLVNGKRLAPFPQGQGFCEICKSETIAKCGEKVMWHWSHKSKKSCDPWWENETEWHRNWKSFFPEDCREVVFECNLTGEKHRADIITKTGVVVEVQNSPISLEELRSRETFYQNLVWVVNASKFRERFCIYPAPLPDPTVPEFDDMVFWGSGAIAGEAFWRKSENPEAHKKRGGLVLMHRASEIQPLIDKYYIGHHPFKWTRPHTAWIEAKCPVVFDFGNDILWRLESYRGQFMCVRAIAKRKFIHDVMVESKVTDIATRFYPINEFNRPQGE